MQGLPPRAVTDEPIDDEATFYTASVGIGSPATFYNLLVDTASANTWVGAGKPYVPTSSSQQTEDSVGVNYGDGSFSGIEFIDQVSFADLVMPNKTIGVANTSTGFPKTDGVDGVIGLGPVDLSIGTLLTNLTAIVPTIADTLFCQGNITTELFAIFFEPTTTRNSLNGEITWGGADSSKFTGNIIFTPITTQQPAALFWGIDQSITYGPSTILSSTAGIIDTRSTLIHLATDAFNLYRNATGATLDPSTGLLRLPKCACSLTNLQSLFFVIDGVPFEFTANAQIWPRSLNTLIGGIANQIYLVVADLGSSSGSGLDFMLGVVFLQRFYSVFDFTNKQVGFANTPFTHATTN
ncbi:aspartic peptidase domain-containing protein [Mycena sp. CBHHK59/15]|nr:aspartic peptidase domain-containing protein [Mycena sp. CBHHK59/15]